MALIANRYHLKFSEVNFTDTKCHHNGLGQIFRFRPSINQRRPELERHCSLDRLCACGRHHPYIPVYHSDRRGRCLGSINQQCAICVLELVSLIISPNPTQFTPLTFQPSPPLTPISSAAIVQPLVVPGISLFNVIPSLHLHILARSNNPKLALWFSSIIATMFFASAVIFLAACPSGVPSLPSPSSSSSSSSNNPRLQSSFAKTECPAGSNPQAWDALVALQLCSFVGYVLHGVMAWTVIRRTGRQARDVAMGLREMPVVDEEQKRREEEEARRRWRLVRDL